MEMLTFTMDTESGISLYSQLYHYIKLEIQSGRIPWDTKLPSKRKLSSYMKISQNTIQAAYDQLVEEGYVVSIERKGFFVNKLENIAIINTEIESEPPNPISDNEPRVLYDFSYHGVDMDTFPFSTWRKLTREVVHEYDKELLQLGDSQGSMELRESIAAYLRQSRGVHCSKHQVIISAGTEYLFQILIQLMDSKSVYGIENPGYEKLNLLFQSNRAKFQPIMIDKDGMILQEIESSKANILCITPAHQFPSGGIMTVYRRIQILNWANASKERFIIEDDYDSEFKYSGRPIPALQGLDTNGKVIYMGAFSKSLSPALRVSYMVLPEQLLRRYKEKLSFIICPVPTIEQKVLYRFIKDGYFEKHLNKMRNIYKRKREAVVQRIMKFNCPIQIIGADAGLHLLLSVENGMTESQLISSAMNVGARVYGLSRYYISEYSMQKPSTVLIGYATMTEKEILQAVEKLMEAWFGTQYLVK